MSDLMAIGQALSVWLLPVVTAITIHEAAHGWMAARLGDDTAKRLGRVSFNPIRHIDPFGTLILPGLLLLFSSPFIFGFAKPVPVAFHRLNNPKRDMIWVALAGPAVNVVMALAAGLLLHPLDGITSSTAVEWLIANLTNAIAVNVVLACFNMLPLPPLDGGRVLTGLLPRPLAWRFARIEPLGLLILIALVFIVPFASRELGYPFDPLAIVLLPMINAAYGLILVATGW